MKMFYKIGLLFSVLVLNLSVGLFPGRRPSMPWGVGERLEFSIRWGVIRAGVGTLEVRDSLSLGGRETFRIVHTARSARFFDPFYRVRNRAESFIDSEFLHTVRFERIIREGSYSKDSVIIYDHEYGAAYEDGERFEISPGVHDVLSAFYYLRTMDLEVGESYEFEVGSDKKIWPLKVEVTGREKIRVPAGEFNALVVEPRLEEDEGIFKQEDDVRIWVSDDERKIPLLIRSSIKVGSVSVYLVDMKLPRLK